MNVAIIPARGGSKRIPGKNIRDFLEKPVIAYSIQEALKSGIFERVIVSTDSEEIAEVALSYGAEVPFLRPKELSGDMVGTAEVICHGIQFLHDAGECPCYVCCIYATAPFVQSRFLREGVELIEKTGADNAFSITSFPFPVQRAQKINPEGFLEMAWPEHRLTRSQDLPELYHDAGQFYWIRTERFLEHSDLYANAVPVMLPRYLVQDIDTEEDWQRAELMYRALEL